MSLTGKIKNFLKRFLPPPTLAFNREIERVLEAVQKGQADSAALRQQLNDLKQHIVELERQIQYAPYLPSLLKALEEQKIALAQLSVTQDTAIKKQGDFSAVIQEVKRQTISSRRSADEAVWAAIFSDTIVSSTWLKDKTFSPGRWAMGYTELYLIYRILNEARPKHILELGLGQSTRMIGQYAAAFDDVEHIVVEHDIEWINFFNSNFELSERSRIVQLDREMVPYKEAEAVRVFKGFKEALEGQRFDFICIDAPLGSDMKQYSRIDTLKLLPAALTEDFVIMMDDHDRVGEQNTVMEIERKLQADELSYYSGRYMGKKGCMLICSESRRFIASL